MATSIDTQFTSTLSGFKGSDDPQSKTLDIEFPYNYEWIVSHFTDGTLNRGRATVELKGIENKNDLKAAIVKMFVKEYNSSKISMTELVEKWEEQFDIWMAGQVLGSQRFTKHKILRILCYKIVTRSIYRNLANLPGPTSAEDDFNTTLLADDERLSSVADSEINTSTDEQNNDELKDKLDALSTLIKENFKLMETNITDAKKEIKEEINKPNRNPFSNLTVTNEQIRPISYSNAVKKTPLTAIIIKAKGKRENVLKGAENNHESFTFACPLFKQAANQKMKKIDFNYKELLTYQNSTD